MISVRVFLKVVAMLPFQRFAICALQQRDKLRLELRVLLRLILHNTGTLWQYLRHCLDVRPSKTACRKHRHRPTHPTHLRKRNIFRRMKRIYKTFVTLTSAAWNKFTQTISSHVLNIGFLSAIDEAEWDGLEPFDQLRGWHGNQTCNGDRCSTKEQENVGIARSRLRCGNSEHGDKLGGDD